MKESAPQPSASRWMVLASLCVAVYMSTLDMSIVNVALATMARDFGLQVDRMQLVVVSYALAQVALVPISGRASDILGRTRTFTWGFVVFIGGSALCSLAWSLPSLVLFRVLQGIGGAMLQGNSAAITTAVFPPGERGRAFGLVGATVSAGILTGPVLGGLLTAWGGWPSIFWVNVPVGLLGFVVGRAFLPPDRKAERIGFDYPGAALFAAGAIALISGLSAAAHQPWLSLSVGGALLAGAGLLLTFIRWERRAPDPLMPPAIFASPGVAAGFLAAFISFSAGFASIFLTPYVMQDSIGFSPSVTGLIMTASPVGMIFVAPISGYLSDRFGPRWFTMAGLTLAAAGLLLLAGVGPAWRPQDFYWRILLLGVGWGLFNSPNVSTIMSAVPQHVAGVTGGLQATIRNAANTTSVALAATLFTWSSGGVASPAAYLQGYRTTLLVAAAVALTGLIPAATRAAPGRPRAGRSGSANSAG